MLVRKLFSLLVTAAVLLGCQTLSSGGIAQDEGRKFANDDEFRAWFGYYYRDPHPELLTAGLHYMHDRHYLIDFPDVAAVFLSRVFVGHPDELADWTSSWSALGPEEWNVILVGLWLTNTPASRDLVTANLSHVPPERQAQVTEMLQHDPAQIDPATADVVEPRQIQLIWAAFSVTGDERYVKQVIGYLRLYGDEDDGRRAFIGEVAMQTLASNTMQHDVVARICTQEDAVNPDPRTRLLLRAMLNAVAQMRAQQNEGESLPAH